MADILTTPRITILDDPARAAAEEISALLDETPSAVLGLATGGTMIPVYRRIAEGCAASRMSLARTTTFNLDEYVGLPPRHRQSYHHFMTEHLVNQSDMNPARMHLPDGAAPDPDAEAARYEAMIARQGPIDLQLLGIGANGHIGFNEPGSPGDSRTRVVELTARTRRDNARYFAPGEPVPTHAITMGIATILAARRIVLLATGSGKAQAIASLLEGVPRSDCPASFLLRHRQVHLLLDPAAASLIRR
ncbi:glucosamine-6-phosphate deaminase [Frigidibacter sp. ROC022]|uniref:glucosamine-6-phosphate deaminase n=1 Tax=Frigidibacter sp. ROC022 TaxID=2971796 RepID=UPI00215A2669|nr:glucosamine-6-phosphate deaminase [Frigidibacter sp. ROC022]MCR8724616.1 glucosamine-6-phosphate deaminase [Frigidibacter sp. ROC022]